MKNKNNLVIILSIALGISLVILFFIATKNSQKDDELQILNSPMYSQFSFTTVTPQDNDVANNSTLRGEICARASGQKFKCEGSFIGPKDFLIKGSESTSGGARGCSGFCEWTSLSAPSENVKLSLFDLDCTCYLHETYVQHVALPSD
jgi:hypothetical protein